MSETIVLLAVLATVAGAVLSTIKGYFGAKANEEVYKVSRLISSTIIAVMTALAIVNFGVINETLSTIGLVGLIVVQMVIGFGTDQGLSKLDK